MGQTGKKSIKIQELLTYDYDNDASDKFPDEFIVSNLYYVSLTHQLRSINGESNTVLIHQKEEDNQWLINEIPDAREIRALDFDNIKNAIPDLSCLCSCDALFYAEDSNKKCFLIEFKATSRQKLMKYLDLNSDNSDQIIKKIRGSKKIFDDLIFTCSSDENIQKRTHMIIVYAKNDMPYSGRVTDFLPGKTDKFTRAFNRQMGATQQKRSYDTVKRFEDATKLFSDYVHEHTDFCGAGKADFPGNYLPDDKIRYTSFMAVNDFKKLVDSLLRDWDWGQLLNNV